MTRNEPWTLDDITVRYGYRAASYVAGRYRRWSVDADDLRSVISVWVYGEGLERMNRWLANDPQQTTRIYRTMVEVAVRFAEQEKADQVGYQPHDVFWYSPRVITEAMPHVLNPDFTECSGMVGELATTVVDIRRVMTEEHYDFFGWATDQDGDYAGMVQDLCNRLGSRDRPYRRKAMTNAAAQAINNQGWGD